MALAADTDEYASILRINGKGWNPKLFISKIADVDICKSCNNVCKDAVELGCDHDDNEIEEFCKECLVEVIRSNNNQCPIDASHKNPPVISARALRKQILAFQVNCPNSIHFVNGDKNDNDGNNIDEAVNMVYDTLDEKEGDNIKYIKKSNNNNNGKQQECEWNGTLKELISDHIKNCTVISEDLIMGKIKNLTHKIDKNKNDNNKVIDGLNDKIKELKNAVNGLNDLFNKEQEATNNKLLAKNEEIVNLSNLLKQQQNDNDDFKKKVNHLTDLMTKQQETTNAKLAAKDEEITNQKKEIDKNKNDNIKIVGDLNDKIKELNDLLNKEQEVTNNKLSVKNEEILNLKKQIDKNGNLIKQQQNDINIIKQKLKEKDNEIVDEKKQAEDGFMDSWDPKKKGPNIKIERNMMISTKGGWSTIYGKTLCEKGYKYKWRMRITSPSNHMMIGVVDTNCDVTSAHCQKSGCWIFNTYTNGSNVWIDGKGGNQYGRSVKTGDIVEMCLDLKRFTLSFSINGTDYGSATDNLPTDRKYHIAISTSNAGTKVELLRPK